MSIRIRHNAISMSPLSLAIRFPNINLAHGSKFSTVLNWAEKYAHFAKQVYQDVSFKCRQVQYRLDRVIHREHFHRMYIQPQMFTEFVFYFFINLILGYIGIRQESHRDSCTSWNLYLCLTTHQLSVCSIV